MKKFNQEKKKILVGLSGGVDSSVGAAILKTRGYEVEGFFLRLWRNESARLCQGLGEAREDEEIAKEIAKKIGIEFRVIDARDKFKKEVVKYFLDEYCAGRTPNPCVFCNENLKFKILFNEADKIKADWVATGHYARIKKEKSGYKLFKARDKTKDQSYFLYRLKQKQLARLIFPLGEYKKTQVKNMARKFGFATAEKKESQNACFLSNSDTSKFLKNNLKLRKGRIIDQNGKIIGEHEGLPLYTIGQRKGIKIGGTGPYYVSGKDLQKNILLATNEPRDVKLDIKEIELANISWTGGKIKAPLRALVATRYQQKEVYATIEKHKTREGTSHAIVFERPQKFIAPGQSAVFYSENGEVIGGGIIKNSKQ